VKRIAALWRHATTTKMVPTALLNPFELSSIGQVPSAGYGASEHVSSANNTVTLPQCLQHSLCAGNSA
jgi:hypothetical protein